MSQPDNKEVYYINPPSACDMCHDKLRNRMYDARTRSGHWGNLCHTCYMHYGVGLGVGKGQGYKQIADGRWLKVAG